MANANLTVMGAAEPIPTERSEIAALIHIIDRATRDPSVDIDKLQRLMDMQERIMERNAKASFASALSCMQPELPVIIERGKIQIGTGKAQMYALWEDINDAIKPVLAKNGFALSFRTGQQDGKIIVTGILSHRDGHSEETTMHLPVDTSGSKNAVQAVGSSTSYGKRYTASALLNLTSRGEDDDGKSAAGAATITQKQADDLNDLLEANGKDRKAFLKWAKVERLEEIPAANYDACVKAIEFKAPAK
jgi:hypothetical protein